MGDGVYDRTGVYTALDERHPDAKVIIPPRVDAVLSATADTEPTQRDRHIQAIAGNGRMAWQRDSGYNQRAGIEGQFARWKQVIGDGLRFHSDEARATEVAVAAQVLNRIASTSRRRTPSASPDQQRGMGPPLPLPFSMQHAIGGIRDDDATDSLVFCKRGRRQTLRGGSLRARLNGPARVDAWRIGCRKVMADQAAGAAV